MDSAGGSCKDGLREVAAVLMRGLASRAHTRVVPSQRLCRAIPVLGQRKHAHALLCETLCPCEPDVLLVALAQQTRLA